MPSLSEITSDIPVLAQHFLEMYCEEHGRGDIEFMPEALQCLLRRPWRGNIRELQNTINRAVLLCDGQRITPGDLMADESGMNGSVNGSGLNKQTCFLHLPYKKAKEEVLTYFTRSYINNVLTASQGNVTAAARQAGMERQALQRLMRRFGIDAGEFRA